MNKQKACEIVMENERYEDQEVFSLGVLKAIGLTVLYCYILKAIVGMSISFFAEIPYLKESPAFSELFRITSDIVCHSIILIMMIRRMRKKNGFSLRFDSAYAKDYKLYLLIISMAVGYYCMYRSSLGGIIVDMDITKDIEKMVEEQGLLKNPYGVMVSVVIIAPVYEEIIMRGLILEGLLKRYKAKTAIIFSALMFGGIHGLFPQVVNGSILGIIIGILYCRTKSLFPCIAMHFVNNSTAIVVDAIWPEANLGIGFFIAGTAIFLISGLCILKKTREEDMSMESEERDCEITA